MNKITFYKYASIGLLILNLAIIGFIVLPKPKPHNPAKFNFKNQATELLNLDTEQSKLFSSLTEKHSQAMNKLQREQKRLTRQYFDALSESDASMNASNILSELSLLETNKIKTTAQHFTEVKNILKPEQMKDYELFLNRALNVLLLDNQRPPLKKRD